MSLLERKLKQIREEFDGFIPPVGFAGGCMKSTLLEFCVQLRPDGTIGKIEENCDHFDGCKKGYKYHYHA